MISGGGGKSGDAVPSVTAGLPSAMAVRRLSYWKLAAGATGGGPPVLEFKLNSGQQPNTLNRRIAGPMVPPGLGPLRRLAA